MNRRELQRSPTDSLAPVPVCQSSKSEIPPERRRVWTKAGLNAIDGVLFIDKNSPLLQIRIRAMLNSRPECVVPQAKR